MKPIQPSIADDLAITKDHLRRYRHLNADGIAALIKHLGIQQADVMGYSLGGGVALQPAIRHPELVRKLVVVSTTFKREGWYPGD